MRDVLTLLKPRYWSFRSARHRKGKKAPPLKLIVLGGIGILFWGGLFTVSFRVLSYFQNIEDLGDILAFKLLSMVFITFLSLLIFSGILTSLSRLYLSRDLPLVFAMPVASYKLFIARWIESTFESSWMVGVYTLPVFFAYGIIYQAGFVYYLNILSSLLALSIIASGLSALLIMLSVIIVPATRIRSIFVFVTLAFFLILFFAFRLLRPERLVDPDVFETTLVYLRTLRTPTPDYLPSTWAFDSFKAFLSGQYMEGLFQNALSWSFAGVLICILILLSHRFYFGGVSKTQTATARLVRRPLSRNRLAGIFPGSAGALVTKEIRTFFRDQTQWSQLFLIAALIIIYVYNFKVLPLDRSPIKTIYLQNLLSFLNMGLAAFVLSAITARFAYPAVSMEREAFWLVQTAPVRLRLFLWTKFVIYFVPLLVLTEILIVSTNLMLQVTPFMMILSTINILFIVPGVVSLGIGMGAAYPDFKAENPVQSVTSFGGLLFMLVAAGFIGLVLILEAGPVYRIFMAGFRDRALTSLEWVWTVASFTLAAGICTAAFLLPMRYGHRRLSQYIP
jgi:ABC-2 type transport system permease protein